MQKNESKTNSASLSVKRGLLAGMVLALTTAAAAGCSTSPAVAGAKSVRVVKAAVTPMEDRAEQDADIVASSQVNVVSKGAGDVAEVLKKRGDVVTQGEVLLRLDTKDAVRSREKNKLSRQGLESQLDKTAQDLGTNKAVLRNTIEKLQLVIADLEKSYNNVRNDYDSGTATKEQVEKLETQLKTSRLDLDTAKKQLANLEGTDSLAPLRIQIESADLALQDIDKSIADFEVRAPVSGILTDWSPETGITVSAGYVAGVIQQIDPVKLHADVTEATVKRLQGKKEILFVVQDTGEQGTASISYLAEVMSPQSKTYVLELSAPNAQRKLKPGMHVKLQLGTEGKKDGLAVPESSIVKDSSESYVFVQTGDHVEKRKVALGRTSGTSREVLNGIKEGEQVVISGQQELKDQDKTTVRD